MVNVIKVKSDGVQFYLDLEDFEDFVDTEKVDSYSIKSRTDGSLVVKFYDKKNKVIKPNAKK